MFLDEIDKYIIIYVVKGHSECSQQQKTLFAYYSYTYIYEGHAVAMVYLYLNVFKLKDIFNTIELLD